MSQVRSGARALVTHWRTRAVNWHKDSQQIRITEIRGPNGQMLTPTWVEGVPRAPTAFAMCSGFAGSNVNYPPVDVMCYSPFGRRPLRNTLSDVLGVRHDGAAATREVVAWMNQNPDVRAEIRHLQTTRCLAATKVFRARTRATSKQTSGGPAAEEKLVKTVLARTTVRRVLGVGKNVTADEIWNSLPQAVKDAMLRVGWQSHRKFVPAAHARKVVQILTKHSPPRGLRRTQRKAPKGEVAPFYPTRNRDFYRCYAHSNKLLKDDGIRLRVWQLSKVMHEVWKQASDEEKEHFVDASHMDKELLSRVKSLCREYGLV